MDLVELAEASKSVNTWYLLIALMLMFFQVVISAYRWRMMLSPTEIHVPLHSLTSIYLVGNFFNKFLPTVLGGDIMRGYELARISGKSLDSATTVLMERICGFVALFVICWISLAFGFQRLEGTNILPIVAVMSLVLIFSLAILLNDKLMGKIISLTRIIKWWNLENTLRRAYNSLHHFTTFRGIMLSVFAVSLVIQLVGIASTFLISQSLGLNVSFVYFLIVLPIIWVITMVPVSIAGLGVREGAFVLFFTQQGVSTESALALSLLFFSLSLTIALAGGIIYGLGKYRRSITLDKKAR